MQTQRSGYRADIDGLRAVAVLAVIAFHAFPEHVPGGFIGVDVFFVISGFLITSIIVKDLRSGSFTLLEFYARRARRILPALIVLLLACLAFGWFALLPDEYELLSKHVTGAALFVSNFLLWQERGYFDLGAELKPLLHLWSLGIEEQFYLIWPLLLMLFWHRGRRLWLFVGTLVGGSFLLNILLVGFKPAATFYFPVTRFWELGIGCLLAFATQARSIRLAEPSASRHGERWGERALRLFSMPGVSLFGLAIILAPVMLFHERMTFPGWAALLPTVGAACIIAAGSTSWVNRKILARRPMVAVGLISYSLYLWHWPLLSFAHILESGTPTPAVRVGAVVLSFLFATLSYLYVEVPVRRRRSVTTSLGLAGGLATLASLGVVLFMAGGFAQRSEFEVKMLDRGPHRDRVCFDVLGGATPFGYCRTNREGPPDLLVLGDSHAQAIYDGAVAHLGDQHTIMLLGEGGCPPLLNVNLHLLSAEAERRSRCRDFWNTFVEFARRNRPTAVVLVGRGAYYFERDAVHIAHEEGAPSDRREIFKDGLRDVIRELQKTSRVVYVLEQPYFDTEPSCFMRPFTLTQGDKCQPVIPRVVAEQRMRASHELVLEIQAENPALLLVDPMPLLCDRSYCYQKLPGIGVIYSDADHLNPTGGRYVVAHSELVRRLRVALQPGHEIPRS
jgi:peptidoglycan/LPS O-acetylase OafA/YrhL